MLQKDMHYLLKSYSKTTSLSVRLYHDGNFEYYYSPIRLQPDPVLSCIDAILATTKRAGVVTTNLYQHYGYVHLESGYLLIIGPTAALSDNKQDFESLLFFLDIPSDRKQEYLRGLCCSPEISAERLAWMLSFFITALYQKTFGVENIHIDVKTEKHRIPIAQDHSREIFDTYEDVELSEIALTSYRFEQVANFCVKNGQVEKLEELLLAAPKIQAGKMASDTLRQTKNMVICSATTMSRAAVEGGLNPQSAFKLSDLYIQKCEILRDPNAVLALVGEMALDFTARVRDLNYNNIDDTKLFEACSLYIKKNLFTRISTEEMARELGFSRSYLSKQFHRQTGKTLTEFILEQKILESKQLLRYSDKSISEIAMHLSFSSQSHFQNVFKKQVGVTPLEYKKQIA